MVEFIGSVYLLSTAAFSGVAIAVGLRLLLLARRTGEQPERMLGLGLLMTAGLGYGLMIFAMIGRQAAGGPAEAPFAFTVLSTIGWVIHNLGVLFMLRFIVVVFRPGAAWARDLALAAGVVMWAGWGAYAATGGLSSGVPHGGYWVAFSVIGTYPLWTAYEAFRYYGFMRKREGLGLANPLVANRLLLWGLASLSAAAAIWTVNIPVWAGVPVGASEMHPISAGSLLATSVFGIGTVCIYWLTFFPPEWYRARFAPREQAVI